MTANSVLDKPAIKDVDFDKDSIFSHYAESGKVTEAYVMGTPIQAICGKIFVPHRDPEKFPVCPNCKEIAEALFLI
jgi:hypothetical protein